MKFPYIPKGRVAFLGEMLIKVVPNKVKWVVKFVKKIGFNLTLTPPIPPPPPTMRHKNLRGFTCYMCKNNI